MKPGTKGVLNNTLQETIPFKEVMEGRTILMTAFRVKSQKVRIKFYL